MQKMTEKQLERYAYFNAEAPKRELSPAERLEYRTLGEAYATHLNIEREEHMARRKKDMEEFLAEKAEKGADPAFERDFAKWLVLKGWA